MEATAQNIKVDNTVPTWENYVSSATFPVSILKTTDSSLASKCPAIVIFTHGQIEKNSICVVYYNKQISHLK